MENKQEKYLEQWKNLQNCFKTLDNKIKFLFTVFVIKVSLLSVLLSLLKKQPFPKAGLIVVLVLVTLVFLLLIIIINPWIWGEKNNHYLNLHYFGEEIETDVAALKEFLKKGKKCFFWKRRFFCLVSFLLFSAFLSLIIGILIIL